MKTLTDEQKNEIRNFAYLVLTINPFISEKILYKNIINFAKNKKMPVTAVKKYLKESE